ncbi:uncharacterized protein LOC129963087 isoform X3 [Argiope bruennichi]|uniref:uncharacterized protein LOC129963087 isoform X3 n=1 Tax=Argiope bruennichi TaxID=94029 RepID=UPI002495116A|nr:uncharacterized protein LOC129963087 isoform X3 [Argiope bruennichi]
MSSMQIVFLFDLNAYNDGIAKSIEELQEKLICLRLTCLRILTHYSSTVSNFKWGFKFFDSRGSLTQTMCNFSFPHVSLENFETLENEICLKFHRHFSYLEALTLSAERSEPSQGDEILKNKTESNRTPHQLLHLALTQILCEYHWNDSIDMFSPSTRKNIHKNRRNLLFLISKCASNADEFKNYFGTEYHSINSSKLNKLLLSQSLQQQLLYKEAIQLIWLNTCGNESFMSFESDVLNTIADSLRSLHCALIPLSVLSFPNCVMKLNQKLKDLETSILSVSCNPLVPFPSSVNQSISYPFYKEGKEAPNEIELCFFENTFCVSLIVTKVPVEWNKKEPKSLSKKVLSQTNCTESAEKAKERISTSNSWTKFMIYFAVARHVQLKSSNILLCMPHVSAKSTNHHKFQMLIKSLLMRNINLFVICESSCGSIAPGIFTPLSDSSAVISVLEPNICFTNTRLFNASNSFSASNIFDMKEGMNNLEEEIKSFELNASNISKNFEKINERSNHLLKPFTMPSMERWFVPTSSFCNTLSAIEDESVSNPEVAAFHNLLKRSNSLRNKPKKKDIKDKQKHVPKPAECSEQSNDKDGSDDSFKDFSYDQLIAVSTETYAKALKSHGSVLHCGRKIIKMASSFFLKQSIINYEENMKNFMTEFFLLNCRKLIEKYGTDQDEETVAKAINECKLQTILALEMEILFPSVEESSCANSISSILGIMSFFSGATVLVKYLQNDLLESYGNKLYNLLVEIGDELCIPLKPDDDSLGDPFDSASPVSLTEIASSVSSATLSLISSQSTSNKSDGRKLIRKRSDISVTSKRRQILLPGKSPRKKKSKNTNATENIPIRYSPRLASKKKRDRFRAAESHSKSVRRNLFAQDKKIQTPRSSTVLTRSPFKKKKVCTPKRHHVLKTDFVPDTPTPKQNLSRLQRRKSQLGLHSDNDEVLGSTPSKSTKEQHALKTDFVPNTPSSKQNLSALQRRKSHICVTSEIREIAESPIVSKSANVSGTKNYPSCSSAQYTPESKRRLSLKLFSKTLVSPTARMGLKKCSKRLFDQVESQSQPGPSKRTKFW